MGGFGGGTFGTEDLGEYAWARRVLYDLAPDIYLRADTDLDYVLRQYSDAIGMSFTELRRKIASFADLRNPRAVRTQYNETGLLRLGRVTTVRKPVEQGGLLGSVSVLSEFVADRGRFTEADVGKELTLSGSSVATNNRSAIVTNIVSSRRVLTTPPLTVDAGPLKWELRELEASDKKTTIVGVFAGDVENIAPGWVLTDGYTECVVRARAQFKAATDERKLLTQQEGLDGSINALLRFTSPTIALTSRDVGRQLVISGAVNPENVGRFEIVDVLSSSVAILNSTSLIFEPTGELVWALLRDAELTLEGTSVIAGAVEQSDEDGEVSAAGPPATFKATSANFTSVDVGKLLTVHKLGSANNGTYEVLSVVSYNELTLDATLAVEAGLHWELRAPTQIGDGTQVEVRASSLIQWLAKDFGVEIDTREDEEYQRRWVESVPSWAQLKGNAKSYEFVASLTGFDAEVFGLYRVSQEVYLACLAAGGTVHEIGEDGPGRFGTDGSLTLVGALVQFSAPTAAFSATDIGKVIDIAGSGGGNDGLRTIASVVNATTVQFRAVDAMTGTTDPNNGALAWYVTRLYSEQAPTLPVQDEINVDLMTHLKTSAVFTIDKYCWEQSPSPWSTLLGPGDAGDGRIHIIAATPAGASVFPQTYTVTGRGDFEVVVGLGIGKWKLTDSGGAAHYLETVPRYKVLATGSRGNFVNVLGVWHFTDLDWPFLPAHVGKMLVVENAGFAPNNQAYRLHAYVSGQFIRLSPPHSPATPDPNAGSLRWTIYDCEQSGFDGSLTLAVPSRFSAPSGVFAAATQGKRLVLVESGSGNDRTYALDTLVGPTSLDLESYDTPVTPDANNGALVWFLMTYEFEVVATAPPALGAARLQYLCPEQSSCDYCRSNKVLVEATTPYLLEGGFERLQKRLDQVTPKHVERIENFGVRPAARLSLVVTLTAP
jgi:hypothetical protein